MATTPSIVQLLSDHLKYYQTNSPFFAIHSCDTNLSF